MKVTVVSNGKHGAEPPQINICRANLVMRGHAKVSGRTQRRLGFFARYLEQGSLRRFCPSVNQIHDRSLALTDYSGVGCGNKVTDGRRMPMIPPGHSAVIIQTLLHNGPLTVGGHDEAV